MERLVALFARVVFGLVLLGVFGFWGCWEIGGILGAKKDLGLVSVPWLYRSDGVVVGESGDGGEEMELNGEVVGKDARVEIARRYLEKYKSPLLPYAQMVVDLADLYKFDYYWILAIGQQESNLCKKIPADSYNCWGYGINSAGTLRFDSYEAALKSYAEYLDREYFEKGRTTAESIMKKYCPHSNGSWAYGVNHFIEEIESGSFDPSVGG